jgi:hypothetical protein
MGWNTKDPISQMDPLYAVEMENFFPNNGTVTLRNGYTKHVLTAAVGTFTHISEMVNNAGTHHLIAFNGIGSLYNVTTAGAGTVISGGLGTQSDENYTINFRGRLFCKGYTSAANSDLLYTDGSAATAAAFTGPSGDDKNLWRLTTYKGRLYALSISDASMWYGGLDAITGAMTQWDWQSLLTLGGKPWYIGSFSMTGGDVSQDYFAVISEQGEVLLYSGNNPSDVTWSIVGRYFIPSPVGRKAFFSWGSDILVITYDGLVSIKEIIGSNQSEYSFLTDNIAVEFKAAIAATSSGFLNFIQGIVYPKGQYLLINFYNETTPSAIQYVMNTHTRAWCKFTGQRAICWSLLNNALYFGAKGGAADADGYVALADNGYFDESTVSAGTALTRTIKLRHAFNYLGNNIANKVFTQAIPTIYQSDGLDLTLDCDVDYTDVVATSREQDLTDTAYKLYQPRMGLINQVNGSAVSIRIDGTVGQKRMSLQATKVYWLEGGID